VTTLIFWGAHEKLRLSGKGERGDLRRKQNAQLDQFSGEEYLLRGRG
jgi:hypothetical protein